MLVKSLILLGVLIIQDATCNTKNEDSVVVARYKIKNNNKPNFDPTTVLNITPDNFPEVEYPSSIVDSSKPFYMNVSPFPNDVKTAFKSQSSSTTESRTTKANPTIILNLKTSDNGNAKSKNQSTSEELKVDNDKLENENGTDVGDEELYVAVIDDTSVVESDADDILEAEIKIANITEEEMVVVEEVEYMISLMDDLDEFITILTEDEDELNKNDTKIYEPESYEEFEPFVKSNNNETAELDEDFLEAE